MNLILLSYHEPWRDEAQAWLLARALPLWKLPRQMSYEGHPCLWHVIMYPFAHFGLSYFMRNAAALQSPVASRKGEDYAVYRLR